MKTIINDVKRFLFIILALLATACSKPKEETATGSDSVATSQAVTEAETGEAPGVRLKGIYVTSTQIPAATYGHSQLFDGDNSTYWATMPGAGPDEGIMLYFQSPQSISHLEIVQPTSKNLSAIESITIYINGSAFNDFKISEPKFDLHAKDVQSLFIRIDNVANTGQQVSEGLTVNIFPAESTVGISEIRLYADDKVLPIKLPSTVSGSMTASSTLEPAISYGIRNLFDSRKEFVWVEGAKGGGENESLTFRFNNDQEITGLKIMNGFQRSDKHFSANGRVKSMVVSNDKNESREVALTSEQGEQTLQFDAPLNGKELTLTVKEIYSGAQYKDLVISELKFINKNGDFILEDNVTENIKQELLAKSKNTVLEKVLDKRISNDYQDMGGYKRSIILRSDYTFVAYSEEWTDLSSGSETNEIIADGNWEIKELGTDQVKIRIFGKLIRLSETSDYYQGNSSNSYLQIFQDNLYVNDLTIVGDKFIQEIKLPSNEN